MSSPNGRTETRSLLTRRSPAASGSVRVIGPRRVDRNIRALRTCARAAARVGRATELLALQLLALDTIRPKGMSPNTGRVAAVMAAAADFRSGRRARPGRQVCAEALDLSERTIERHWRILEGCDAGVELVTMGRWLTDAERAEVYADSEQANRWRDRSEWRLSVPEWARELDEADLAPYLDRARALLAEVGYGQPVDISPGGTAGVVLRRGRVAPSRRGVGLRGWLPVRRDSVLRPSARQKTGGASRHSSTEAGARRDRARPPSGALLLARRLAADRRFTWTRRVPMYLIEGALRGALGDCDRWTPDDVYLAGHLRIRNATYSTPAVITHPHGYLAWMLADVDPAHPPATEHRDAVVAESEGRRSRTEQARAEHERQAAAAAVSTGEGAAEARRIAVGAAARAARADRHGEARIREELATEARRPYGGAGGRLADAHAAYLAQQQALALHCVGCGVATGDVELHATPSVVALCGGCWQTIQRADEEGSRT